MDTVTVTLRKKRSQPSRRPKPEGQAVLDPSLSSTPGSDDMSQFSSDENIDGNPGGKMCNLNQCVSRSLPVNESNVIASDRMETRNRPKKFKLKVGGITRTIQAKSGSSSSGSSVKANQLYENAQLRHRLIPQGNSDEYQYVQMDKKSGLQGIPWKDFSANFDMRRSSNRNDFENKDDKPDAVRKSKRMRKKRAVDEDFDEDDEDDEIRYLEKLKSSKMSGYKGLEAEPSRKRGGKVDIADESTKIGRDAKKSRTGDVDFEDEEGPFSDVDHDGRKKKRPKKDLSELQTENRRDIALTNRQRALLSKDSSSVACGNQIEFPNGLPPAPPRKQKEKLTEVEQQLKKAEAAQRRRLQNEKAARETEEEAIRKILGQDSSRKKREEKIKKRQEELAKEKMATALMHASNTVRTVMGPNGTTVTFPQEMGYPKIFEPNPPRYPSPREMCAGPSCRNPYKYRDSKWMLPLCSLQCFKAIHESMGAEKAC